MGLDLKAYQSLITDEAIAAYRTEFEGLDAGTKEGYEEVRKAIAVCRTSRTSVEKKRKELNEDAQSWIKTVNAEAKRLTELLEGIEEPLKAKKQAVDDEKARVKAELEAANRRRLDDRIAMYLACTGETLSVEFAESWSDDKFANELELGAKRFGEKQEAERLEKMKREAEEAQRLEALRKQQEELDKQREALERERAEQEAERRKREEELAKERAEVQAFREKLEKIERERVEALAAQEREKIRLAMLPELEKAKAYGEALKAAIESVEIPKLESEQIQEFVVSKFDRMIKIANELY